MNLKILFGYVALLAILQFLALDITLPIFVTLTSYFQTTAGDVQQSASAYLLGMAAGQVLWGALSDTFGRRSILIVSLGIFTLATLACTLVPSIEWLWVARFIQAVGVCAPAALWQSILVDTHEAHRRDIVFAWIFPITALSPIFMPMVGAFLLERVGFESTFVFTAAVGVFLLVMTFLWLKETLPVHKRHPLALHTYIKHALNLMSCPVFMGNTGLICLSSASFYVFLTEFPFVLDRVGLSESAMGPLIIPQTIIFMLGGALSAWMARAWGKRKALLYVTLLAILGGVALCASVMLHPLSSVWQVLIPYAVTAFSNGAIYPLAFSLIFEVHDDKAGTAAGWVAFYLALMGFVGAFFMGLFSAWGEVGMALLVLGFYVLCLVSWMLATLFSEKHVTH
ncbi:MAG: Bcr/CflA family efflux MFS transporter [Gammaproteobacteria bacterium]